MEGFIFQAIQNRAEVATQPGLSRQRHLVGYVLALLMVPLGFGLYYAFEPTLDAPLRYLFFVPAVLVAGAIGGFGPGCLATIASVALGVAVAQAELTHAES